MILNKKHPYKEEQKDGNCDHWFDEIGLLNTPWCEVHCYKEMSKKNEEYQKHLQKDVRNSRCHCKHQASKHEHETIPIHLSPEELKEKGICAQELCVALPQFER